MYKSFYNFFTQYHVRICSCSINFKCCSLQSCMYLTIPLLKELAFSPTPFIAIKNNVLITSWTKLVSFHASFCNKLHDNGNFGL